MRVDAGPLGGNLLEVAVVISKLTSLNLLFFLYLGLTLGHLYLFLLR